MKEPTKEISDIVQQFKDNKFTIQKLNHCLILEGTTQYDSFM